MDALPLEIKQNICSFLSPNHLKPLRLVSKEFASAAIPHFIPRIFLFNHHDSCLEVNKILRHPKIPKYINTLIVDPTAVQSFDNFDHWLRSYDPHKNKYSKTEREDKWRTYYTLHINQANGEIDRCMASVVRTAFSNCRNLKNFILASFHPPNMIRHCSEHRMEGTFQASTTKAMEADQTHKGAPRGLEVRRRRITQN
ncbi:hypothetical protein D6C83_09432 [Aureobasidium pullulans]|uniref:F-box domain-containing protein n=1 Tax=Aureobasidium pullulans TaxID=5580 RepID=A0A4S9Y4U2_AURPU|nr:hypothetical protein D6C83_09432 [Aureobasidium pullulans]